MNDTLIAAENLNACCLKLLEQAHSTGQALMLTRNGKPWVRVLPVVDSESLFGAMAGSVLAADDLLAPVAADWKADQR